MRRSGRTSPWLRSSCRKIRNKDVSRKLYPNVDFYSGVIYNAIGTPSNLFTALFALGRLPGWIAQWMELHADPQFKIGRPRQIYTGPTETAYTPIENR